MKVLITSGGTRINLDLVRHIGNMSRGTFGSKIATEFLRRDNVDVTFLAAKDSKMPNRNVLIHNFTHCEYVTFDDYALELDKCLAEQPDIIVLAAAVSDYGVENPVNGKIRSGDDLIIRLKPLPKLISTVREKCPKAVLCGFKLLVNSTDYKLKEAIRNSIEKNKCDLVIGNDLRDIKNNDHQLIVGDADASYDWSGFDRYSSKEWDLEEVVVDRCLSKYNEKNNPLNKLKDIEKAKWIIDLVEKWKRENEEEKEDDSLLYNVNASKIKELVLTALEHYNGK